MSQVIGRILAVPGLSKTTPAFRRLLLDIAERNGWEVDALAAVISSESGFKADARNTLPGQTATGLIQMTDATAKGLGIKGGAPAGVLELSAEQQLPYVEAYFRRAFGDRKPRRVDYYLALWGNGVGRPAEHVLARESDPRTFNSGKDNLFTLNKGLDRDKDGQIEVSDLDAAVGARMAQANGQYIEVTDDDPLAEIPGLGALGWAPGSRLSPLARQYLSQLSKSLPVLRRGNRGDLVAVLQFELGLDPDEIFGRVTETRVLAFQDENGIDTEVSPDGRPLPAGVVGVKTWARVFELAGQRRESEQRPEGAA